LSFDIKTIRIYKKGWEMSLPMIRHGSLDKIVLDFDCLDEEMHNFEYVIEHCNADWEKTDILLTDYLEGFERNPIMNAEPSINTLVDFYHYQLEIPNQDVKLLIDGNYKVRIYAEENPDKLLFERMFFVYRNEVGLEAEVGKAESSEEPMETQRLEFSINLLNYDVIDPYNDIRVDIIQNKDFNRSINNIKAGYVEGDILNYRNKQIFFRGGKEYRHFQSRNYENYLEGIAKVEFVSPYHIIFLENIIADPYENYVYEKDINGAFRIDHRGSEKYGRDYDVDLTADYKKIVFNMPWNYPITDGEVCISGRYNNWGCDTMIFNYENSSYFADLVLKQGYYNYGIYLKEENEFNYDYFEGSHYQTENDYYFFVYDVSFVNRYDKLIAVFYVNSVKE
jgi:hypothetical protein